VDATMVQLALRSVAQRCWRQRCRWRLDFVRWKQRELPVVRRLRQRVVHRLQALRLDPTL